MAQKIFHVLDIVDDYLHQVLTPAQAEYVEEHCYKCTICDAALGEARKRLAAVVAVPAVEASEQLIQQTVQTIEEQAQSERQRRRLFLRYVLPAVAAVILVLAGLHLYFLNLTPSTYEITLLGPRQLLAATTGSLRIRLADRSTGAGIPRAAVSAELRDRKTGKVETLGQFETDAQGTGQPRLQLPDWIDGDYELRVVARTGWWSTEEVVETVKLMRSWKLMLTTDKPVYQPGQQIRLRSLALRKPDLKPVAAQEATFAITDPKGNVIFKRKDLTSKFGIAALDCPLATEIIEGPYTIACKIGDTESKLTVEVKKYVLPKFKLDVLPEQRYYQPGQVVKGKVQADYFFGKPVADAQVELRAVDADGRDIRAMKLTTDTKGTAAFEFKLPDQLQGRAQENGAARVVLQATVTDPAGQKQSRAVSRTVTAEAIHIEVIPEAGTLVQGVPNKIYLFATYPDGQPAAKTNIMIANQEKEVVTGSLGVATVDITPERETINLTIKATDAQNNVGRRAVVLRCDRFAADFIVRTDKAVYSGGDTVTVNALGSRTEPIFIDFIKDGQTLLTETIPMRNGGGSYQFDLPAELFGTVEMIAYRFDANGIPVRKSRILYIRQAGQVNIRATLDRQEYRPGAQAKLRIALSDKSGKAVAGAVSMSAVDEAVFAVLEQMPGMEKAFYTLEQKLLEPVYAIYPWSPDLTNSQGGADSFQLEQALFSRTARMIDSSAGKAQSSTLHALSVSSLPASRVKTERMRTTALKWLNTSWFTVIVLLLGAGLLHLCLVVQPIRRFRECLESLEESPAAEEAGTVTEGSAKSGTRSGFDRFTNVFVLAVVLFVLVLVMTQLMGKQANSVFTNVGANLSAITGGGNFAPAAMPARTQAEAQQDNMAPEARPEPKTEAKDPPTEPEMDTQAAPVRVREYFPETLLWKPELITDEHGNATLDIDLADSITTWRLSASAVTTDGQLGATQEPVKVFQPFFIDLNLPVTLTRGDQVAVPVVVYNYLSKPQTVTLELQKEPWFDLLDGATASRAVELKPSEQKAIMFPIKVVKVGLQQPLTVKASAGKIGDAIKRLIEVVPDGLRNERVVNGTLVRPVDLTFHVPTEAIEGSPRLILKLYASNFSQLVEGLDNIFRMPYGCFEQTSSTTYPNILALDYMRRTGKTAPAVEAKARQFIHLGYQRLLSFEVQGGGFDWFGRPPANRTLTAYGLMEFVDMAKVHAVDPHLIARTRQWLLNLQQPNGSWPAERRMLNDGLAGSVQQGKDLDYATTAYIGWAVFEGQPADDERALRAKRYLLNRRPDDIDNVNVLALTCNTLLALSAPADDVLSLNTASPGPYLQRLEALKRTSPDGKLVWWEQSADQRTMFYGRGQSGNVETTALAVLALIRNGGSPGTISAALSWLVSQKDSNGTWYSTQATVLALKALVAGTSAKLSQDRERRIEFTVGGQKQKRVIPADQGDVMQQIDLTELLKPGDNRVTVQDAAETGTGYQVAFRYHIPATDKPATEGPLAINLAYDRDELVVNDIVKVKATVRNLTPQTAPMVMLDLPIPAGFALVPDGFAKLIETRTIEKYQVTGRQVIVYLSRLEAGKTLELEYQLRATLPVKVTVPGARVYEYYDPSRQGSSPATRMTVGR